MTRRRIWLGLWLSIAVALAPAIVDAKAGGGNSMGSRGGRTFQSAPATPTAPKAPPVERSVTPQQPQVQPPRPSAGPMATPPGQASSFAQRHPFLTGFMGGLVGAGIGGLLFGNGFFGSGLGGAGVFGLFLQAALVAGIAWLVIRLLRRRGFLGGPAWPNPGYTSAPTALSRRDFHSPGENDAAGSLTRNLVSIDHTDYNAFERLLSEIQTAWSNSDLDALRPLLTPEMLSYFSQALSVQLSRNVINRVEQVKLLQGDLAEAWREKEIDYATVAMRWQALDYTVDCATGRVVAGDRSKPTEATEVWTFLRSCGGSWLLSAIQPTEDNVGSSNVQPSPSSVVACQ